MINSKILLVSLFSFSFVTAFAAPVSLSKAKYIASDYVEGNIMNMKCIKAGSFSSKSVAERVKKMAVSPSKNTEEFAPYYIFSRGIDKGFVIVSGDDALPEVLGYTENGDFDENDLPPFLDWYLKYYSGLVEAAQKASAPRYSAPKYAVSRVDIEPLIKSHWHQDAPYNNYCPDRLDGGGRCVTGCVATAASQILYYWRKDLPDYTLASTSSYSGASAGPTTAFPKGTPLKWDLMRTQYGAETYEYKDAVATLLAIVGGAANLSYGSSTSGHNSDCISVFRNIFGMNGGKLEQKDFGQDYDNYSDEAWSKLLYNELMKNHPILYSGNNEGAEAGHAVVVDGYRASDNLFHINMGWGNPSYYDGYFNLGRGKTPSWGYNACWQDAIIGVCPSKTNIKVSIEVPAKVYLNTSTKVKVNVENHGTLDDCGIYLFCNRSGAKPTSLTNASAKDESCILTADGSRFTFNMNATATAENCYFIVTDSHLNILDKVEISAQEGNSDLWLRNIEMKGCGEIIDGYSVIYNEKGTACATIENKGDVDYSGTLKINIYQAKSNGENEYVGSKSGKFTATSNTISKSEIQFNSTASCKMSVDSLYYGIVELITSSGKELNLSSETDSVFRFVFKGGNLEVVGFDDGCLTLKGNWDINMFNTIARKTIYKTAMSYDLTNVVNLNSIEDVIVNNPNVLFYVSSSDVRGHNAIFDGVCNDLYLKVGYDFVTKSPFIARSVSFDTGNDANLWNIITTPCDLDVPDGIIARSVLSHARTGISGKTADVKKLNAGETYLIMTSSKDNILFGKDSHVVCNPSVNVDTAMVGTFISSLTPANSMMIDSEIPQYFVNVDSASLVEALRGYFCASDVKNDFRAFSSTIADPVFLDLGKAINTAIDVLDEYAEAVNEEDYISFSDSILKAQKLFSNRDENISVARQMLTSLNATIEWYITRVINDGSWVIDYTSFIQNPSFETGSAKGWDIISSTISSAKSATNMAYLGVGSDGKYLLYSSAPQNESDNVISQTIENLPAGQYKLTMMAGTDPDHTVSISVGKVTKTIDAHPLGQYYLNEVVIDSIIVEEGQSLTISVKSDSWYKVDNFKLYNMMSSLETAIIDVKQQRGKISNSIYDLAGRKIHDASNLLRGIYIVNGKKILR